MEENEIPEELLEIAIKANKKFPNDIRKSTDAALREIEALEDYESELQPILIWRGVRESIYTARDKINDQIRKQATCRDRPVMDCTPKTKGFKSTIAKAAHTSIYLKNVAGRTLGFLTGKELPDLVMTAKNISKGWATDAKFLQSLIGKVPDDKTVRESIAERELDNLYREALGVEPIPDTIPLGERSSETEAIVAKRIPQTAAVRRTAAK